MQEISFKRIKLSAVKAPRVKKATVKVKFEYMVRVPDSDSEQALNKADAIKTAKRYAKDLNRVVYIDIFDLTNDCDLPFGLMVTPQGEVKEG